MSDTYADGYRDCREAAAKVVEDLSCHIAADEIRALPIPAAPPSGVTMAEVVEVLRDALEPHTANSMGGVMVRARALLARIDGGTNGR